MVESISHIQQLLAESRFVEVQKECELLFLDENHVKNSELLKLYFVSLQSQSKPLPSTYLIKLIDVLIDSEPHEAQEWIKELEATNPGHPRIQLFRIRLAENLGQPEQLFHLISDYQLHLYQLQRPNTPEFVQRLITKYFPHDFKIQLQALALDLMRKDIKKSETEIKNLILSCFEKSSPKGTREKLNSLWEVLKATDNLGHLEIYKNFCQLLVNGISDKKDYKKIIELVIYADDFKLQVMLLNLLSQIGDEDLLQAYATDVRKNKDYNYVYLDKYFTNLKRLFFQKKQAAETTATPYENYPEAKPIKRSAAIDWEEPISDTSEMEALLIQTLKHQAFTENELLELAISFLQSELPHAALSAAEKASSDPKLKLKANYLKVTCLLKIGDYRAAIDSSLAALETAESQNDILSFLYAQAEALLRLNEYKKAKLILKRIISIDASYRLAKERLERLNEV